MVAEHWKGGHPERGEAGQRKGKRGKRGARGHPNGFHTVDFRRGRKVCGSAICTGLVYRLFFLLCLGVFLFPLLVYFVGFGIRGAPV